MSIASELSGTKPDSLSFLHGVKDCIPTLLGYVCIGFAAGIVGASSGVSTMEIAFMSALVYAGASQFIMCSMLAASNPPSVIILTTFIVNARHLLLSASLAPYFSKYSLWKNIGIGALLTDESFGVASDKLAKGGQVSDRWMNGLNITAYLAWIASCVAGGVLGNWISRPEAFGLDFALPAMFLALLISQLQSVQTSKLKHRLLLVLCMAVLMYLLSWWVPSHIAVIVATMITATIGVLTDK
ncbi:AzlC family ABC transporter permease [Paenibacillus sp. EKM212P]|uniref:AzlC family ABC transporter permease n=1 Tax=Paenibacillus sp. EKM212P TaxID=1683680 RepID=UPI0013EC8AA3|nr:AzlC family ABC transporter permease [Paenibacillus sp. EKM212P]KAF6581376.1 AzlC family ABC transporter permease [Paenibacillus sp. EKM212P]